MARILGIDYGLKRTGIAVTDPLQIIASSLDTVATGELMDFLKKYIEEEEVEAIIFGEPLHKDGNPTHVAKAIYKFIKKVKKEFPDLKVELQDERYSSAEARKVILNSGAKKKKRRDKALVDKISAALILEEWMKANKW